MFAAALFPSSTTSSSLILPVFKANQGGKIVVHQGKDLIFFIFFRASNLSFLFQ